MQHKTEAGPARLVLADNMRDALTAPLAPASEGHWRQYQATHDDDGTWLGLPHGAPHADAAARLESNPEGERRLVAALDQVGGRLGLKQRQARTRRASVAFGDQGDELDLPRAWSGDLDHAWTYIDTRQSRTRDRRVHLIVNVAGHCGYSAEQIQWGAIAGAVACSLLQRAGWQVQVTGIAGLRALMRNDEPNRQTNIAIKVKRYRDRMTPARLARLADVAFFRFAVFRAMHCVPGAGGVMGNLGYPRDVTDADLPELLPALGDPEARALVLPMATSEADARAAITAALELDDQARGDKSDKNRRVRSC